MNDAGRINLIEDYQVLARANTELKEAMSLALSKYLDSEGTKSAELWVLGMVEKFQLPPIGDDVIKPVYSLIKESGHYKITKEQSSIIHYWDLSTGWCQCLIEGAGDVIYQSNCVKVFNDYLSSRFKITVES